MVAAAWRARRAEATWPAGQHIVRRHEMRAASAIVRDIETFAPINGDWRPLDALLSELWAAGPIGPYLGALFGIFERFPDEDGAGVFWSVVHGVENSPIEYEVVLRQSMERQPSHMGKIMLRRLENSRAV